MLSRICSILALAFVFAFSIPSNAATLTHLWSHRFGDTAKDVGHAVAVDASGNVFIAGSFQGTADFGGGALVSAGLADVFLAKYDADGVHQWSKRFGNTGTDVGWALAVDASGHVVVVGNFVGTVDFGGGPVVSAGSVNAFAAKYDTNGLHVWSRRLGGSDNETAYAVTADVSGNIIVTGEFIGSADFGGGPLVSAGWRDIFVVKYDANGAHQWSQRYGSDSADTGLAVAADATGSVFVAGEFQLTVDFGGGNLVAQGMDIFVAKYDANGAHQWSQRFGDAVSSCLGMVADTSGSVVLTGFFADSADFGGGTLTTAGDVDIFLVKFDGNGTHQWSRRFGGASYETGYSVAVDATGNVFLTGDFRDTFNFGGGDLASAGLGDIFVAKYNASGVHEFSERFGDTGDDTGHGAAVDASGNVIVTGSFNGTVDFGGGALTSAGASDVFFAKYRCEEAVAVSIQAFDAFVRDGAVELRWEVWADEAVASIRIERYDDLLQDGLVLVDQTFEAMEHSYIDRAVEANATYHYVLGLRTASGTISRSPVVTVSTPAIETSLGQNYPNPFNPRTTIEYTISKRSAVTVSVFDARGRLVRQFNEGFQPAGTHRITWDGRDRDGQLVGSGMYFHQLTAGEFKRTRKMVLIK
jgi:hypothetical protein